MEAKEKFGSIMIEIFFFYFFMVEELFFSNVQVDGKLDGNLFFKL